MINSTISGRALWSLSRLSTANSSVTWKRLYSGKERVMELMRYFVLFDANVKKICRYQQYFAIKEIIETIQQTDEMGDIFRLLIAAHLLHRPLCRDMRGLALDYGEGNPVDKQHDIRTGIVELWHTQGSGKSLTMVMLAKYILMELSDCNPCAPFFRRC